MSEHKDEKKDLSKDNETLKGNRWMAWDENAKINEEEINDNEPPKWIAYP